MSVRDIIQAAAGAGEATDPFFNQTVLLLHGDGTNGGQNNTFIDGSSNNFTVTRNGNTTQGSFSPYGNLWSNYFDGTGDWLALPNTEVADIYAGDFTIEAWVNSGTNTGARCIYATGWPIALYIIDGVLVAVVKNGVNSADPNLFPGGELIGGTISLGTWTHVAFTRDGNTYRIFNNGVLIDSYTASSGGPIRSTAAYIGVGNNAVFSSNFNGYISNLRIVKGTAVYTSNFTPPTAPLTAVVNTSLLTCQSNRFVDNSSNNFTLTPNGDVTVTNFAPFQPTAAYNPAVNGGSGYFDGAGDWLQTTSINGWTQFGTGDFSIECWVNVSSFSVARLIIDARSDTQLVPWQFFVSTAGKIVFYGGSAGGTTTGATSIATNTWNHVAVTRSGTTLRIFVNGVVDATATVSATLNGGATPYIGRVFDTSGTVYYIGYIADLRVVIGSAVYTTTFTPPTAPLTNITNTSLLCNFVNAAIFDNTQKNVLETVGNAQIDTTIKKYGTGSLEFDGTDDCLTAPSSVNANFGTGDFTIEMWVYANSIPAYSDAAFLVDSRTNASWFIFLASNELYFGDSSSTEYNGGTINTGAWYHVAICRSSGTIKGFVDGVQAFTFSDSGSYAGSPVLTIGARYSKTLNLDGYIDDLRITNGVARYTATFTPPAQAFPNL